MPLPKPKKGEKQSDFLSRCISFETKASPDRAGEQVQAMCYATWRRAKNIKASEDEMPEGLRFAFFDETKDFKALKKVEGTTLYRKPILKFGTWRHPDNRDAEFEITPEVVKQIAENFMTGVPVEAPIVLTHTDDPKAKVGGVKQFIPTDEGLDALFSVADEAMIKKIDNEETAPGVSCWLDLNYKDKKSNDSVGAVVKHVALVNHPYIEGLGGYQVVSLSDETKEEKYVPLVMSEANSNKEVTMKLEEILEKLKKEHKIDVAKLQEDMKAFNKKIEDGELVKKEDAPALSKEVVSSIVKKLELAEDTGAEDAIKKLLEKVDETIKLSEKKETEKEKSDKRVEALEVELTEMKADKAIDSLVTEGKVLPAEKEGLKKVFKTDQALFTDLMKSRTAPLVELAEKGLKSDETPTAEDKEKEQKYIDEQAELAEKEGLATVAKT